MKLDEAAFDIALGRVSALRAGGTGGRKVLALHGWLDNAASFVPLAPYLAGLDLVLLDLPGHGRSAHLPAGAEYTSGVAVNAVLDVADALGWQRFSLLGHSMGAGIASLIAASSPQRIDRLVAIEALGALSETEARTAARWREAIAAARALPGKKLRVFADLSAPVRARMVANQLSEAAARLLVERGVKAVDGGYVWSSDPRLTLPTPQRLSEAQIDDLVAGIDCPTRVIYADPPQPYFPEPLRSARVARLPRGQLRVITGTHHLHMEDPAAVAAAIGDFLA
ncbi:epoxide hydrolase. Serine peptidase. MEROPS family S33 [Pseudoxanthomonas wuyuanensis]|uniref:Epoxide hydrolase. Serine peptidase. MEROPS family S33 n=1 Tax=Pseudoxanthomonas wuyuanensis TaxID=1073196 RepID=A0A286D8J6_9GAMM|nr:epoxide hydrolase. Serine peptidase. MEROPS family S33 [Pseudoxanthomonas wuyuanensis]